MRHRIQWLILFILILGTILTASIPANSPVYAALPIVRAALFFSPDCPQCHHVMEKVLPPLAQKYRGQLDIVGIDVSQPLGQDLYQATVIQFNIPNNRLGVPTLVIGDEALVGTNEILERLPALIEIGLSQGGVDWPEIPGLAQILAVQPIVPEQLSEEIPLPSNRSLFVERFANDLLANHIAVFVLLGMIACVIAVGYNYIKGVEANFLRFPIWAIPLLAIVGMGVAIYLSNVELTGSQAICGPVGNCNSVQQSPYARLFGVIPIGVVGIVGYLAVLIAWIIGEKGPQPWRKYSTLAVWVMGCFGVLFSIYLTYLEPFVIGATCIWCITSAIIMTLIMLASTDSAKHVLIIAESDELESEEETKDQDDQEENNLSQDA